MFGAERARLRGMFFSAWRSYRMGQPLQGVENLVVDAALKHPEYHDLLDHPERHSDQDFAPALGESNPFLHLSMHIAIAEQLSIDHPRGVRAHYQALKLRQADEHGAQHAMMDCLGEMLWQAQRDGSEPSETVYLECLAKHAGDH